MVVGAKLRGTLLTATAAGALAAAGGAALAGGFINQSQSTVYNGMAYAGYAAPGGSPSAMFLNPAIMTEFSRITTENNFSVVVPETRIRGRSLVLPAAIGTRGSGDISQDVLSPATYVVVPLGSGFTVGAAFNAPYGSVTKPVTAWGGRLNSLTTKAKAYTLTPAIAYQITPELSIGVGAQIQFMKASFESAGGAGPIPPTPVVGVKGEGWGFGITAGLTWKPFKGTQIGVGYRSRIDQDLEGDFIGFPGLPAALTPVNATVKLPDRLNVSIRQTILPEFDLLASVEWHNWSRIGNVALSGPGVGAVPPGARVLPFGFRDAWFFALGGEYRYNPFLTLRAGVAYEISPITTSVRNTRLPDNDRIWASIGASYQITDRITINASYSHLWIKEADINIATVPGVVNGYVGTARASADIFSLGFTTRWGSDPVPVLAQAPVVRKY